MRLLIVEDDKALAQALAIRVRDRITDAKISHAFSLAEAVAVLDSHTLDAVVVDLRLPSKPGAGDAAIEFGLAVEAHAASRQPGALRLFLTASEANVVLEQLRTAQHDDFFRCAQPFCLVDYRQKLGVQSLDECVTLLAEHADRLSALDLLPLNGGDSFDIDSRRALALAVRVAGGSSGTILKQEGLSDCVTALVECFDEELRPVGNAFCKSGPADKIEREVEGYRQALYRLPTTSFPILSEQLHVGTGANRALVFTRAPTRTTFFDLVANDPVRAALVVSRLPLVLTEWTAGATVRLANLRDLVANALDPACRERYATGLTALRLDELVDKEIQLAYYTQHGDLHGANMFVTDQDTPFLIDFAHTALHGGPVDSASLELSLVFHPKSPLAGSITEADCERWFEDGYVADKPGLGLIVAECRRWTAASGHDRTAQVVATLMYALWILGHDAYPNLALALAKAALLALD